MTKPRLTNLLFCAGWIAAAFSAQGIENNPSKPTMVSITAGQLIRGDSDAVRVLPFSISSTELTWGEWTTVRNWALEHGYDLLRGVGETPLHPVSSISWHDAVKFCNAASERACRVPVYRVAGEVYRAGMHNDVTVDLAANGYRLPSEAEWEYACRAGTTTPFYWGNESMSGPENPYAWQTTHKSRGDEVSPSPVGLKKPNAFGLFDTSGNVSEWCWDCFSPDYDPARIENPVGPDRGHWRILRGGSVALDSFVESGRRNFVYPFFTMYDLGFRIASSDPACPAISVDPEAKPVPTVRDMSPPDAKATAEKLFDLIDLNRPGLEKAVAHFKAGRFEEALTAYRDYFFAAQRAIPLQSLFRADGFGPRGKPEELEKLMALQGRIPWYLPLEPAGVSHNTGLVQSGAKKLLKEWETTRDASYLQQWFRLVSDFALHAKSDFELLDASGRSQPNHYNMPLTWDWGMGFNDHTAPLREIQKIVHALPPDGASQLPPLELAWILNFIATDGVSVKLKDPREAVPNQVLHNDQGLVNLGYKLPEFRDASAWREEGKRRFVSNATRTVYPDGGDLEQAYGYNAGLPRSIHELAGMFGDTPPDWVRELQQVGLARLRLFAGVTQPIGGMPTTGSGYADFAPGAICHDEKALDAHKKRQLQATADDLKKYPDPLRSSIYNTLFGNGTSSSAAPAFTSIAFPYSGYYVMRDGWNPMSRYLWFMAARPGQGHGVENINSLEVVAFGRSFLTSGGASSYGNPKFVSEDQWPVINQIDAYRYSSHSRNTVLVDGKSQSRRSAGFFSQTTTFPEPIAQFWHSSADFDLVDGLYNDGYYSDKDQPGIPVEHRRRVVFIRGVGIWLVIDRMQAPSAHTYTAVWNFTPKFPLVRGLGESSGFSDEQIVIDNDAQRIATQDPKGANLYLYQAAGTPVTYERFYGALDPARGWLAPGIVGRRYPKTDIWSSWKGGAGVSQLVTAICPSAGYESPVRATENLCKGAVAGIKLDLNDGGTITWQSAPDSVALESGVLSATAEALLVVTNADGRVRGLVNGCRELKINGVAQSINGADFEFAVEDQRLAAVQSIRAPESFAWRETGAGAVPVYHAAQKEEK